MKHNYVKPKQRKGEWGETKLTSKGFAGGGVFAGANKVKALELKECVNEVVVEMLGWRLPT